MLAAIASLLALVASPALATIYTTAPVASTIAYGGQTLNVSWVDDGSTPTLATIGPCTVDLYVGSSQQQTLMQNLAASVDVSKASYIMTTIDPTVGASGLFYFVRYTSLGYSVNGTSYEQFSARFTLENMTGNFTTAELAQISGSSAVASSTSAKVSSTSTSAKPSTSASSTHASASASASSSSKASSSAARSVAAPVAGLAFVAGLVSYITL